MLPVPLRLRREFPRAIRVAVARAKRREADFLAANPPPRRPILSRGFASAPRELTRARTVALLPRPLFVAN